MFWVILHALAFTAMLAQPGDVALCIFLAICGSAPREIDYGAENMLFARLLIVYMPEFDFGIREGRGWTVTYRQHALSSEMVNSDAAQLLTALEDRAT